MILLDTHVLIWMRARPERLSIPARDAIVHADQVAISDISLWEIAMLARKGRIDLSSSAEDYLADVEATTRVLPISAAVAATVGALPDDFPTRDPADQLIYSTAQVHGVFLVSADRALRGYDETVVWR